VLLVVFLWIGYRLWQRMEAGPTILRRLPWAGGCQPGLVAERVGHDLNSLLRTYAHVIRQDDERVRAIVDATLGGDAEDWLRTEVV
jgi:hypothetical protein